MVPFSTVRVTRCMWLRVHKGVGVWANQFKQHKVRTFSSDPPKKKNMKERKEEKPTKTQAVLYFKKQSHPGIKKRHFPRAKGPLVCQRGSPRLADQAGAPHLPGRQARRGEESTLGASGRRGRLHKSGDLLGHAVPKSFLKRFCAMSAVFPKKAWESRSESRCIGPPKTQAYMLLAFA